jgi:hypothetical protein
VFAFPAATLAFLRDLREHNERAWFEAHGFRGVELGGRRYKRVPRGYDAAGEAARFLLHDALYGHSREPADVATDPGRLMPLCEARWTALAPLHRWLVDNVQ